MVCVTTFTEQIQRNGSVIIVAKSTESCKYSHQQQKVSEWIDSTCDVRTAWFSKVDCIQRKCQYETSVHDVTKHDSEKEGERDACKHCGISFFVCRHSISVDNLLEHPTELCFSKISWSGEFLIHYSISDSTVQSLSLNFLHVVQKFLFAVAWHPYNSNKMFSAVLEHLKCFVDCLFFIDELLVYLND